MIGRPGEKRPGWRFTIAWGVRTETGVYSVQVAAQGLERPPESPGKTSIPAKGGAESGAPDAQVAEIPSELREVINAWPSLPEATRRHILGVVRSVTK